LGGNKLTLLGVKELIADNPKKRKSRLLMWVVMERTLADYGLQHNIKFNLIGVDANNFTVKHAICQRCIQISRIIVKIYLKPLKN
jgi:hypothetical protein